MKKGKIEVSDGFKVGGISPQVFSAVEEEIRHLPKHRFDINAFPLVRGNQILPEGQSLY